jgi:hypothetical protein
MKNNASCHATSGALYGTGIIGAFIYFMQNAHSFWDVVSGIVMSFFWPGVLVYKALEMLRV